MPAAVISREQTAERFGACREEIRGLGVIRIALSGSVLRGQANPQSDIDLHVRFAPGGTPTSRPTP